MAYLSQLAKKQFSLLFEQDSKLNFEKRVLEDFVYAGFEVKGQFVRCCEKNIHELVLRFNFLSLNVIGVQSNIEHDMPFYTFIVEEYIPHGLLFGSSWLIPALTNILLLYPDEWFRFYVDIQEEEIAELILRTGIPFN